MKQLFTYAIAFTLMVSCSKDKTLDLDITQSNWELEAVEYADDTYSVDELLSDYDVPKKNLYLLKFKSDVTFDMSTFNNAAGGSYSIPSKGDITVHYQEFTEVGAPLEISNFNKKLIEVLNSSTTYTVKGDKLTIVGSGGEAIFELED